jgi:hypothetical protein
MSMIESLDHVVAAFVPGTVVCLERGEANHWTIVWMVRPALATLPD